MEGIEARWVWGCSGEHHKYVLWGDTLLPEMKTRGREFPFVSATQGLCARTSGELPELLWFPHLSPAVMEMECDGDSEMLPFPGLLMRSYPGKCEKTA